MTDVMLEMLSGNLLHAKNETVTETSLRKFYLLLCTYKHLLQQRAKKPVFIQNVCANSYPIMPVLPRAWLSFVPELVPVWMAFHTH